jgi:hypothetical protein
MPKAFMNKEGKLVAFDASGKPFESDDPFIMPDSGTVTIKGTLKTAGLKIVDVKQIQDAPKPRFEIKK